MREKTRHRFLFILTVFLFLFSIPVSAKAAEYQKVDVYADRVKVGKYYFWVKWSDESMSADLYTSKSATTQKGTYLGSLGYDPGAGEGFYILTNGSYVYYPSGDCYEPRLTICGVDVKGKNRKKLVTESDYLVPEKVFGNNLYYTSGYRTQTLKSVSVKTRKVKVIRKDCYIESNSKYFYTVAKGTNKITFKTYDCKSGKAKSYNVKVAYKNVKFWTDIDDKYYYALVQTGKNRLAVYRCSSKKLAVPKRVGTIRDFEEEPFVVKGKYVYYRSKTEKGTGYARLDIAKKSVQAIKKATYQKAEAARW